MTTTPVETEVGSGSVEETTPDYAAELKAARAEVADLSHKLSTEQGRTKGTPTLVEEIHDGLEAMRTEQRRTRQLVDMLANPDLSDDDRSARIAEVNAEAESVESQRKVVAQVSRLGGRMNAQIVKAGLDANDARLASALAIWNQAVGSEVINLDLALDSKDQVEEVLERIQAEKTETVVAGATAEAQAEAARIRAAEGVLDNSVPDGGSSSKRQFTPAEIDAMPPGVYAENRKHIVK